MDNDTKAEIQVMVQNAVREYFLSTPVGIHTHNDVESLKLFPEISLHGFRTDSVTDSTIAPTDTPENGTIRILYDTNSWNLWVRVNNLWKTASLT